MKYVHNKFAKVVGEYMLYANDEHHFKHFDLNIEQGFYNPSHQCFPHPP